jgi:hypothetical protein
VAVSLLVGRSSTLVTDGDARPVSVRLRVCGDTSSDTTTEPEGS